VIVVGAGWAGLTAADALVAQGVSVRVVEKSRGPGGRCATRRQGAHAFDHGAQYFTARDSQFAAQVAHWHQLGLVAQWAPRLAVLNPGVKVSPDLSSRSNVSSVTRWVGVPGNNAVLHHLSVGLSCEYQRTVQAIRPIRDGVEVVVGGEGVTADVVVITAPPAQAATLLGQDHPLSATLSGVDLAPCLALMVGLAADQDVGFDAAFINDHALSWLASNQSKPGRDAPGWVVHAGAAWSERHLDDSLDEIAALMWAQLIERVPAFKALDVVSRQGHRWRFSQCRQPLAEGCLADATGRVLVAGDWCAGNRVEGAWLSGRAAAQSVLERLSQSGS
jgi:predicted NAD/FAD-dependent oxidoreductase